MGPERIQQLARNEQLARDVGFWWGLAEGVVFFIVPDVYIAFAALFAPRAGAVAWLASIAGSVAAVCLVFLLTATYGAGYLALLESLPGISPGMIERASAQLASEGLPYTPLLALGGVPLKVYAALAFSLGLPLALTLVWTVFARIVRIAPTFLLVLGVRAVFRRHIDARPALWSAVLGLGWVGFYLFYFWRVGRG